MLVETVPERTEGKYLWVLWFILLKVLLLSHACVQGWTGRR